MTKISVSSCFCLHDQIYEVVVFEDDSPKLDGKDFFQEVFESTKKAITKENVEQGRKKRQEAFEEVVSLAQCQVSLFFYIHDFFCL